MNFNKFYINGNRYTFIILYRMKMYRFGFERIWNDFMCKLTDFTTTRYLVKEKTVYLKKSFTFELTFIEKFENKESAIKRMKELNKTLK